MKHSRIKINPKIMAGKPVIKGTRIPVDLILRALGDGMSTEELLKGYPRLTREDIQAVVVESGRIRIRALRHDAR